MNRTRTLAVVVLLLLLHFALRLHHLLALPLFGDETLLAERAESVWGGHLLWFARESKLMGVWWLALFVPPLPPWLLRAGMLLLALPGTAALLTLARRLFGPGATLPTGILLACAPMLFFFERMALADTSMLTPLAILLLALERMRSRPRRATALLAGAALAAAIMAKATALALLPLPLLTLWLLPPGRPRRAQLPALAWLYGATLALWLPLLALLRLRNIDFLGAALRIGGDLDAVSLPQRLLDNSLFLLRGLVSYFGALPLLLAALLMLAALLARPRRAGLPALASLLALGAVSLTSSHQRSMRYWLLALPPALLLCAAGLTSLSCRLRRRGLALLPWLTLALWLATQALPFLQVAWHAPAELPLPRPDRLEYIEADSAGTMLPELAALLAQEARNVDGPLTVTGVFAQCNTLALYLRPLPEAERIALDCPRLLSPQGQGAALDAHVAALAQQQAHYLVIFEEVGLVPVTDVRSLRLETLAQLPRPGGRVTISVYRPESR